MSKKPAVRTGKDIFNLVRSKQNEGQINAIPEPVGEVQIALVEIWSGVLSKASFGVNDDFFNAGGNSIKAVQLASQMAKHFSVSVELTDIFLNTTIISQADFIEERKKNSSGITDLNAFSRPSKIPLSFNQERLWFIDQLEGSVQYHIPLAFKIGGKLNFDALSLALKEITNRHEILRTVIKEEDGKPYQYINEKYNWHLNKIEEIFIDDEIQVEQLINQLVKTPFDLANDYPLRASLIQTGKDECLLIFVFHHIAADGWSMSVLANEMIFLYKRNSGIEKSVLETLHVQYADYSIWQNKHAEDKVVQGKLDFWIGNLIGITPFQLPTDFQRPPIQSTKGTTVDFHIPENVLAAVKELGQQHSVSLFNTLHSAFNVLLYRYTNEQDICVGTVVANRPTGDIEKLIGFFANTIPLRNQVDGNQNFIELLYQVKANLLQAFKHQDVPLDKLIEATVKVRDLSKNPLFNIVFVLQNTPSIPGLAIDNVNITQFPLHQNTSKFDITFSLLEIANGMVGEVEYCTDLFTEVTIQHFAKHYIRLLESIVNEPLKSISDLPMLFAEEVDQLLVEFNDTKAKLPKLQTIVELFELQVSKSPDDVAVKFEGLTLTYSQLNARANQLALYLRNKGIGSESLVPICLDRSFEMIVGILGILKSGGAYVPIDPEYPAERINYILKDINATVVLCNNNARPILSSQSSTLEIIAVDADWELIDKMPFENVQLNIDSSNLAYVIYTSGSTGQPKGVMVEELGLVNRLKWAQQYFNLTSGDVVLQKTTYCFDVSVWELLLPLIEGAKMVFAKPGGQKDNRYLQSIIDEQDVSMVHFVPSMLEVFLLDLETGDCPNLKNVICSGEALKPAQVKLFRQKLPHVQLHNLYGPTEAAIDVTYWTDDKKEKDINLVPIGKPVANTYIYVVDKFGQLLPAGMPGEIYIGGVQVSRGYLNKPELTAEKFIRDTFLNDVKARMYKTGDIGRWLPDGNIEYFGRIDDQVKIRGNRIEIGEIETVLLQNNQIKQVVISLFADVNGNNNLVGYFIPRGDFNKEEIVQYLQGRLPEYMVPAFWVQMEVFPLTANGKIDKKNLPAPGIEALENEYQAPQNETESVLVEIWQNLLGITPIGINSNFFDIGGHSLLATRMVSAIRKQFHKEVLIRDLFVYTTIARLARHVNEHETGETTPPLTVQQRPVLIPLSFSQERLWFIHNFEGSVQYHMPMVLKLSGIVDVHALTKSFKSVLKRHEVLRTTYQDHAGIPYQQVLDTKGWNLEIIDASRNFFNSNDTEALVEPLISKPFDLQQDYMLRATLISTGNNKRLLVIIIHHIAADGWSLPLFVKEVIECYKSIVENKTPVLSRLEVQYADYAIWQRDHLSGVVLENKIKFWTNKLQNVAPLDLPSDFSRPAIKSTKGTTAEFTIENELTGKLKQLGRQNGSTLFMTLLTAFKILLYRYSGQQDICVGTPVANRNGQATEELIGFFVNTIAIRSNVEPSLTFTHLLNQVKETTLQAYDHQDLPFEKLVEVLIKERDTSRNPLFQVVFALQTLPEAPVINGDLQIKEVPFHSQTSKFDLTFNLQEVNNEIAGTIEYSSDLFKADRIQRMIDHYIKLISSIVLNPEKEILSYNLLSNAEEEQLLYGFNNTHHKQNINDTVIELFQQQVQANPESIALRMNNEVLSYSGLNARTNQLAAYLVDNGVNLETLVPVCIERNIDLVVAIIAIMKAGGAYVPIDPSYPVERISYMIKDAGASIVLTNSKNRSKVQYSDTVEIIEIDSIWDEIRNYSSSDAGNMVGAANLAYVIYTSGSTGLPKGVMVQHSGLVNLVNWHNSNFHVSSNSRATAMAGVAFDAFGWEVFPYLCKGGSVQLISDETRLSLPMLISIFRENNITHTFISTALLMNFVAAAGGQLPQLKYVLTGGDKLLPVDVSNLSFKVVNNYGPTEYSVVATSYLLPDIISEQPPIGAPISNTHIYILDDRQNLVPQGVPGEICIAGTGLAKGYHNRKQLTDEKFVSNPFDKSGKSKLYRTGDIGSWASDGNIQFHGRMDDQVKIRGFRIELGEIETLIVQSNMVAQAVVLAKDDENGNKRLVAYVVTDSLFKRHDLNAFLHSRLPAYMIPGIWVTLNSLPLTANGKIDKSALPAVDLSEGLSSNYVAPVNDIEHRLVKLWEELLGITPVGVEDNFFEIGGHSLLVMRLIANIQKDLNIEVAVKELFEFTTIRELAGYLDIRKTTQIAKDETDYDVLVI